MSNLSKLKLALPKDSYIESYKNIWFDNHSVLSYNGIYGIRVKTDVDFNGGVEGKPFIDFISTLDNPEISVEDQKLKVSEGKSNLKLDVQDIDSFDFSFPDIKDKPTFVCYKEMLEALKPVADNASTDKAAPSRMGVYTVVNDEVQQFYSTNNETITVGYFLAEGEDCDFVLPVPTCKALVSLSPTITDEDIISFYVEEDHVVIKIGDYEVFTKVPGEEVIDYEQVIEPMLEEMKVNGKDEISDDLRTALKRSKVIYDESHSTCIFEVKKDDLSVTTKSRNTKTESAIDASNLEEIKVSVDPVLLDKQIKNMEEFSITEDAVILMNDMNTIFVANVEE